MVRTQSLGRVALREFVEADRTVGILVGGGKDIGIARRLLAAGQQLRHELLLRPLVGSLRLERTELVARERAVAVGVDFAEEGFCPLLLSGALRVATRRRLRRAGLEFVERNAPVRILVEL